MPVERAEILAQTEPVANPGGPYDGAPGESVSFNGSASTASAGLTLTYAWTFGDGGTAAGVSPTHAYASSGSYTVSLKVTDSSGATSTASTTATIAPAPVANAGGPYSGSPGQSISLSGAKSSGPAGQTLTYAWNFGDGSTGTGVSPSHSYTAVGTYTVSLTVIDSIGGSNSAAATATIVNGPMANAGGPYTGTIGQPLTFSGEKSTGPADLTLTYAWNFGDGTAGTGVSPTHTYSAVGTFNTSLTVTDSLGGSGTATTTATVVSQPVASAGGPYNGAPGTAIAFSGQASTGPTGQILSYAWNFGDASTGTGAAPTHTYSAVGSYSVSVTVTDVAGGSSTASTTATIAKGPLANPGGPYVGTVSDAVSFSAAKSTVPSPQTLTYLWNFGDGSTGTGVTTTHSYSKVGTYTVSVTATASGGGSNTASTTATIEAAPLSEPGGPYAGTVGKAIAFSGTSSTGPTGQTLAYAWNFGDGSTGTGIAPAHTYAAAGTFSASLTVTDAIGGSSTATAAVTVVAAPVAKAGGPYSGTVGAAVAFNGTGSSVPTGQTLVYAWNFGDGTTGSGVSPTHVYKAAGTYTVSLTVSDAVGGSSTASTTATIAGETVANPGGPYNGLPGVAISFSGSKSTGPAGQTLGYAWNFGDSGTGSGVSPTHAYAASGTYTVTLTVTDNIGGVSSASTTAIVSTGAVANPGGPYIGTAGQGIVFSGTSSSGPAGQTLTYTWAFGDGSTGSGASPTHSYASTGSYSVSLTVGYTGGTANTAKTTATVDAQPVANSGGPYNGAPGQAISFNGSKSAGPSGQTLAYAWNFGDGSSGSGVNPTHSYGAAGSYSVSLTVSDGIGGSNTASTTATVANSAIANPGGPYVGTLGQPVSFSGAKSTGPSGLALSYAWNFGDGATGTGVSPIHTYTVAGTFTVSLTVSISGGGSSTATTKATISTAPVSNPGGPYNERPGEPIQFNGSASTAPAGQTLTYAWNFGDSSTGSGSNPSHSYTAAGSYIVSLTVSDTVGATNTASTTATIASGPIANPGGPYQGAPGQLIAFSGASSTGPSGQTLSYAWSFGDGSTATGVSPTHSYSAVGTYTVTLTVIDTIGGSNTATAMATIATPSGPTAIAGGPYTGTAGQSISFSGSGSTVPTGQTLTSYAWNFGDGATGTGVSTTHSYGAAGTYTVSLTVTASGGLSSTATTTAKIAQPAPPAITGFAPTSGTTGTVITVTGTNLAIAGGTGPAVTLVRQGGGSLSAPVSAFTASSLSFVVPAGAATGPVEVTVGTQSATSSGALTVGATSTFKLAVTPATVKLIQGQTVALAASVTGTNGFDGTVALSVTGVPSGVTASFKPTSIGVGQTGVLTLTAPAAQKAATATVTITGTATIQGQTSTQTATAAVQVTAISTSFQGRTVVDDAQEEPVAGVTVSFTGKDDKGNSTGCTGQTVSDGGGNFQFANLATACVGPQLISYNGMTATSPAGKYAGVNLSYTLVSGKVVASPVLIHLPRIDNAETVEVQQNAKADQIFYFQSIPGLKVTVYAGTTLSLDDGSQPNPFPLVAIEIPIDRLPDMMPTNGMLNPFIVAFQPANAVASQPVAVNFPNTLNSAPGTNVTFVTLDPTHGYMVSYGTGTVSSDGSEFTADPDPAHPGHAYGLVHFDWHGPALTPEASVNPSAGQCPCKLVGPVDVASGTVSYDATDLSISGGRGSIAIHRSYRSLTSNSGPFGIGTAMDYSYALNTQAFILLAFSNYPGAAPIMNLAVPDGNQFVLSQVQAGLLANTTVPALRGASLTVTGTAPLIGCTLRWADGTQYNFTSFTPGTAYLTSIVDLNGNTTTITRNPAAQVQILSITDPVGRSITLAYDGSNRVTQATDPIGRTVKYAYNPQGGLQTFTDANGGLTQYAYDSSNNLSSITDPRGIVTEQNTYNETFDGRITKQVEADGGTYQFSYTLMNPTVPTSPVLQTVVTDPLGNQTTYRNNSLGYLVSATDPSGQTRTLTLDPNHNNLITAYSGAGVCPVCGNPAAGNVSYTFDSVGNTLTQTDALGNTTTFTYDTRFNKVNSITDPLKNVTKIAYDADGNPISVTDANGNKTLLAYDNFGELIQVTDPLGAKTMVAYDGFGNISSITDALGNATTLSYDAVSRLTQALDPLGRKSSIAYDLLDRVTSQTDPRGFTTKFTYDQISNLKTFTDALNNETQYDYDSVGRLQTRVAATGKSESYKYDTDSNLIQYTDRRGQVSKFTYDELNRLTQETYTDATVTRTYDANSRLLTVNDSQGGTFGFSYDAAGRLLSQDEPTGVVNYQPDALGRISTRQVAGQGMVQYKYDPAGNLLSAAMPNAGVSYTYYPTNLPKTLTRTNGVVTSYTFDPLGQVKSIIHSLSGKALNTQLYTYDAAGNRTVISNDISQPLITQSATSTIETANELKSSGGTTYTYDANGNRLTETSATGTLTYAWDGRNRLSSITDASGNKTAMQYDFGRELLELSQATGGSTIVQSFVVDGLTNLVSLTSQSGGVYSVLTGTGLDSHFASIDKSGGVTFGLFDALGSIDGLTSASGSVASTFTYEPYGQLTGSPDGAYPFSFMGRLDIISSVDYARNRYYDASIGRFLSEDPIGLSGGQNYFEYGNDSPQTFVDPLGLDGQGSGSASSSSVPDYSPCSHYDQMCQSAGGSYYCNTGPLMCHNAQWFPNFWGVSTSSLNCVRKCLVREDEKAHQTCPPNQTLPDKTIDDYHAICFKECGVSTLRYPGVNSILNGPQTWGQTFRNWGQSLGNVLGRIGDLIVSPAY